jgi:hypothetical protein
MKVGTISVLAAAALMPVRNGFVWEAETKSFKIDSALRQVGSAADCNVFECVAWCCWATPEELLFFNPQASCSTPLPLQG